MLLTHIISRFYNGDIVMPRIAFVDWWCTCSSMRRLMVRQGGEAACRGTPLGAPKVDGGGAPVHTEMAPGQVSAHLW